MERINDYRLKGKDFAVLSYALCVVNEYIVEYLDLWESSLELDVWGQKIANHSHSMVEVADSCSNSIMSYHLVIGRPTSNEYSQYRFELSRFAISGLGMRE